MKIELANYNISISTNVLDIFDKYIQDTIEKKESGGILLGQVVDNNIYVMRASVPNKFDKSGRYKFIRNKKAAQILIDYEFINSKKKTIYLGEWHTHPENIPTPSKVDIRMLEQQFNNNNINEKYLLLIIKGCQKTYVGLYDGERFQNNLIDSLVEYECQQVDFK